MYSVCPRATSFIKRIIIRFYVGTLCANIGRFTKKQMFERSQQTLPYFVVPEHSWCQLCAADQDKEARNHCCA